MLKSIIKAGAMSFLALAVAGAPASLLAQSTNKTAATKPAPAEQKEATEKKAKSLPFQGEIATVNKTARMITVGKRTFQITSETKIAKADKTPALFDDAKIGEHITGSYIKAEDGKLIARSIYLGTKPQAKGAADTKKQP